jgi:hypothetical protein
MNNIFRVWDKEDKRMIINDQDFIPLKITNHGVFRLDPTIKNQRWQLMPGEMFIIMQSVGLIDKNGTLIFKDDVCSTRDDDHLIVNDINKFIYTVMYSEDHSGLNGYTQKDLLVIGNIHDKPELKELMTYQD